MKLGVIGGLGPLATAYFYELLTKMSDVKSDQEHLEIIIYSAPSIPDRTGYILDSSNENPIDKMLEIAKILEAQGVDYIAIPCVTAHYFHETLSSLVNVPIIHLVEELSEYLSYKKIDTVGIMATDGTISTGLLQKALEKKNISAIIPNHQKDVMHIIYNNVKASKEIEKDRFDRVSKELFDEGSQKIILGCTELSIVKKEMHLDSRYLDAMELLAYVALKKCNMPIKKEFEFM